jgi:uncharacterized protein
MTLALVAVLVCVGMCTGILAGLLGVGGGVLIVPFLTLALSRSQHASEATSLFVILPTSLAATYFLVRRGVGDLRTGLLIGIAGTSGSAAGSLVALQLRGTSLRLIFAGFMTLVAARLVHDAFRPRRPTHAG